MVILDAQQFGLAQLHQLRGRVGRSSLPSLCIAMHRHELTDAGRARLQAFAGTTDGFELAEADLRLRKEGDVLGPGSRGRATHLDSCRCAVTRPSSEPRRTRPRLCWPRIRRCALT